MMSTQEAALAEIRRQKLKMQEVEEFLDKADAETIALLQRVLTLNGTSPKQPEEEKRIDVVVPIAPAVLAVTTRKPLGRGEMQRRVVRALDQVHGQFNVLTVLGILEKEGFRFGASRPVVAVGTILRKLRDAHVLEEVRPASGRTPTTYIKSSERQAGR